MKGNLAICERHNLRLGADNHRFAFANANLASEISRLQAEISQLQLKAKPTLEQQRAKLGCCSKFLRTCRLQLQQHLIHLARSVRLLASCSSLAIELPWRSATGAYQRLRLIVALARQDLRVCGLGGGSYYLKIQGHLRDHRGCLECSDLIQRLC